MKSSISRRTFLTLGATALAPLLMLRTRWAHAQGIEWQLYRRKDLGFEIELPGVPKLRQDRDVGTLSIDAVVDVNDMTFTASFQEGEQGVSVEQLTAYQRMTAQELGVKVTRETAITMNGYPGLDFAYESDKLSGVMRIIIKEKRSISATVTGSGILSQDPTVSRFLGSLKLLP